MTRLGHLLFDKPSIIDKVSYDSSTRQYELDDVEGFVFVILAKWWRRMS